jgi:valyl-tRNA synthetase
VEPPEGEGWERDPDVLDTWFSSGLWPFATLGWPEATPELRAFYPTDVNSTARDIIFLWVARMVMFGKELTEQVPFTDVNIHSVIQAPDGRRMSKSLGTGIDPSDLIHGGPRPPVYEEGGEFPAYGADALRFGLLAMSSSQDVRFNEERVKQGRDLANKLWNAARLILLRVADTGPDAGAAATVEDRWIVSRLERLTERVTELYDDFRFSFAALELYGGFWSELADWYLELAKPRLYEEDNEQVSAVLLWSLERVLRLLHPVMPFVTEEIWSLMPGEERGLLAAAPFPVAERSRFDEQAEQELGRMIEAVTALRRYRDEIGATPSAAVRGHLAAEGYDELRGQMGRLARFEWVEGSAVAQAVGGAHGAATPFMDGDVIATVPIPGGAVQVVPSDAFDPAEAQRRVEKKRAELIKEIERAERKLANEQFVEKAPPEVVEEERRKLEEYRHALERLEGDAPPG